MSDNLTIENGKQWGALTKQMHEIKYPGCFRYGEHAHEIDLDWPSYISGKVYRAIQRAESNNNYGISENETQAIEKYLKASLPVRINEYFLIHGDYHTSNVLMKDGNLVPFDKNPDVVAGDRLLDLAIAMIDIPNDTLICTDEEKHKDDKLCLEVFLEGYGYNFLSESNLQLLYSIDSLWAFTYPVRQEL